MTKTELSKIRAEAGRKGGLKKAENARKKQSLIVQDATNGPKDDLYQAIKVLTAKIERVALCIENYNSVKNPPPPVTQKPRKQIKVEPVSDEQAKVNFWQNLAKDNGYGGGAMSAILKENKELDAMFANSKYSKK